MKKLVFKIFALINQAYLKLNFSSELFSKNSSLLLVRMFIKKYNSIKLINTNLKKTIFSINGTDNIIYCENGVIENTSISITGANNKLVLRNGVILRKADIIIRGNNCEIEIGERTTFGGIRMINVGNQNKITIGSDCLFSDHIELWACDTHPIYDEHNVLINLEKPVQIGNKVWVGSRTIILKGVTICEGSVVGMGSIITKDVPANSISVGNPNRVIKEKINWSLHPK